MRLESLEISGFRGIPKLDLEFPERVNVLVGVNGVGKSAVLDCAAIMLSRLIGRVRSSAGTGRVFSEQDINNRCSETRNRIEVRFEGRCVGWTVAKAKRGRKKQTITRLEELRDSVATLQDRLAEDERASLPLAVYYPVNRAVLDIPLRIRKRHRFDRLAAYDQALSGASCSFRIFFEWFREREDLENETRVDRPTFRDPQLQAVRRAIKRFLPGFRDLKVKRSPLRMIVAKDGEELSVDQLSDGETCTLAMAGDLARRMAVANPSMENPLNSEAVVLIDEIDLHLHPAWQRRITTSLRETFPRCQFLLSTHSPQILSHLEPECIWMLERIGADIAARRPEDAFGQTAGRVLEDIMNVPARPDEIREALAKLFLTIEQGSVTEAKRQLIDLGQRIGKDPDLVKAGVLIQRKELLEE